MSEVLTLELDPALLNQTEKRAARLGLAPAAYVQRLIRRDLENPGAPYRFASEDLVGAFRLGGASATNSRARENLRRASSKREVHR
ncbi:MAG: hypothetical protein J0L84_15170 [Verrucomicrobia bacterium]|nr:hypothetical protein [Verrucomicrobiota bacterium]